MKYMTFYDTKKEPPGSFPLQHQILIRKRQIPFLGQHQVIQHGDVQQSPGLFNLPGDLQVGIRGLSIPRRMIMRQDQSRWRSLNGHLEDNPYVSHCAADPTFGYLMESQYLVGPVQADDVEILDMLQAREHFAKKSIRILGTANFRPFSGFNFGWVRNWTHTRCRSEIPSVKSYQDRSKALYFFRDAINNFGHQLEVRRR